MEEKIAYLMLVLNLTSEKVALFSPADIDWLCHQLPR